MSDRQWAIKRDGEILFTVTGPDGQSMARSAARAQNGVVVYREYEPPSEEYPASHWGAWQEAE